MQEIIKVKNLSKVFNKPIRGNGLKGMIKTLFSNKKIKFTAVNNISFTINQEKWSHILVLMALENQQQ